MDFSAGTARPGISGRTPKVVFFTQAYNSIFRNACFTPDVKGFIIVTENSYPESGRRDFQDLRNVFPCPGNYFFLKIITETEIPKHFKKGAVGGIAHRIHIGSTETLLTTG